MRKSVMAVVCVAVALSIGCGGEDEAGSESASGDPPGAEELNGCSAATAEDHTGEAAVVIATDGFAYSPACIRVSAGTTVTINSNFGSHPLEAGDVATSEPDESSPIPPTSTGTSVEATFASPGTFGFYCQVHAPGMAGAVFVE